MLAPTRDRGASLVEALVVLMLLSVLTLVALDAASDSVRAALRRAELQQARLADALREQERAARALSGEPAEPARASLVVPPAARALAQLHVADTLRDALPPAWSALGLSVLLVPAARRRRRRARRVALARNAVVLAALSPSAVRGDQTHAPGTVLLPTGASAPAPLARRGRAPVFP